LDRYGRYRRRPLILLRPFLWVDEGKNLLFAEIGKTKKQPLIDLAEERIGVGVSVKMANGVLINSDANH